MRILFCVIFSLFSCVTYSQQQDMRSIFHEMLDASTNKEMEQIFQKVKKIPISVVESENDSTKYLYHYCYAAGLDATNGDKEEKLNHIKTAITLRETKIGIFSSEYLELLWAFANNVEESDLDQAIGLYEKALVKGHFLFLNYRTSSSVRHWYGQCLTNLGYCYQMKGYKKEVVQVYRAGFDLLKEDYDKDDASSYLPLYLLSSFYREKQKDYKQAISVMNEVREYISKHEGEKNKRYADCLFSIAADYGELKEYNSAIKYYNKAISIIKECGSDYSEELGKIYTNLFLLYIDMGQVEMALSLQSVIKDYYLHCNKQLDYYKMLWAASVMPASKSSRFYEKLFVELSYFTNSQKIDLYLSMANESFSEMMRKHASSMHKNDVAQIFNSLQQAKELSRPVFGSNDVRYLRCLILLSDVNLAVGDSLASLQNMYEIRDGLRNISDTTSDFYGNTLNRIDNLLRGRNENYASIENELELLAFTERKFGKMSKERAYILNELSVNNMNVGAYKEAKRFLIKARKIIDKVESKESLDYIIMVHNQGRLEMLKGNEQKALRFFLKSKKLQMQHFKSVDSKTEQYIKELSIK